MPHLALVFVGGVLIDHRGACTEWAYAGHQLTDRSAGVLKRRRSTPPARPYAGPHAARAAWGVFSRTPVLGPQRPWYSSSRKQLGLRARENVSRKKATLMHNYALNLPI